MKMHYNLCMNFWERLELNKVNLTPAEMKVCDLLEENPYPFHSFSASKVAENYNIPPASITRFIKKLGFKSYSDFRLNLALSEKRKGDNQQQTHSSEHSFIELVSQVRQIASPALLERLSEILINSHHIFLAGTGNAYIQAYQLMVKLTITELQSTLMRQGFEIQTLHTMKHNDVVILFSHSNPTYKPFLEAVNDLPADERPYTILVCTSLNHPVRKLVDLCIELPTLITSNTISQANEFAPLFFNLFLIEELVEQIRNQQNRL